MITFSYYPGCSLGSSTDFYDHSLRRVLGSYEIELKELDDWSCCGASAASALNEDLSIALSARNIALAETSGLHLVAPCSACYARTRAAARKIAEDNDTRHMVNKALAPLSCRGNIEVKNIIEVFLEFIGLERIAGSVSHDLGNIRAVAYYGCLLTRIVGVSPSDDIEDPTGMDIILKALGASVVPWQYKTECCGASSTITNADVTAQLSGRLIKAAVRAGAQAIVTTCPLCQLNLDLMRYLGGDIPPVPVFFLPEIFELALFGRTSGGERHLVNTGNIEKGVRPLKDARPGNGESYGDEIHARRLSMIECVRKEDPDGADRLERLLKKQEVLATGNVYGERFTARQFSLVFGPLLQRAVERARILEELLLGPASVPDLARDVGLKANTAFEHIKELARRDRVEIAGYAGRDALYRRK
jgi:heterodisulfide reductase subunit B